MGTELRTAGTVQVGEIGAVRLLAAPAPAEALAVPIAVERCPAQAAAPVLVLPLWIALGAQGASPCGTREAMRSARRSAPLRPAG